MSQGSPPGTASNNSSSSSATLTSAGGGLKEGCTETETDVSITSATATVTEEAISTPQLVSQQSLDKKMQKKVLVRSEAVNDEGSPTPTAVATGPLQSGHEETREINSSLLTVQTLPCHVGKGMSLKQQGSGSTEGSFSSLSRDSSTENYTDSTGIDLDKFLRETLAGPAPKDRQFLLRMELILVDLVRDPSRDVHKFEKMTSYHRMFVHRVAAYFGMEHNIDPAGQCVVVNKSKNTRIPEFNFHAYVDSLGLTAEMEQHSYGPSEGRHMKQILKRDSSSFDDTSGISMGSNRDKSPDRLPVISDMRSKSFEQREEEYLKVRTRIFSSHSMDAADGSRMQRANSSESSGRSGPSAAGQPRLTKGRSYPSGQFTTPHHYPRRAHVPNYDYTLNHMMSALNLATAQGPQGMPRDAYAVPPMTYTPSGPMRMATMIPSASGQPFFYLPSQPLPPPIHSSPGPLGASGLSPQTSVSFQPMMGSVPSQSPRSYSASTGKTSGEYRVTSSPYGQPSQTTPPPPAPSGSGTTATAVSHPHSSISPSGLMQQSSQYPLTYIATPMMAASAGPIGDPSAGGLVYAHYPQGPIMMATGMGGTSQSQPHHSAYQQLMGVQFMNPQGDPACMGQVAYQMPPPQGSGQIGQPHGLGGSVSECPSHTLSYTVLPNSQYSMVGGGSRMGPAAGNGSQGSQQSFDYNNGIPLGQSASSPGMMMGGNSGQTQYAMGCGPQYQQAVQLPQHSTVISTPINVAQPPPPLLPSPLSAQGQGQGQGQGLVMYSSSQQAAPASHYLPPRQMMSQDGRYAVPATSSGPNLMMSCSQGSVGGGGGGDGSCGGSPSRARAPKLKHMKRPK